MLAENLFEKYKIDEDRFNGYFPSIGEFAAGLNNEIHPPRAAIFNLKTAALFLCLRARKERPAITKPREKPRKELTAEMEENERKIRQYEEFESAAGGPAKLPQMFYFLQNHVFP